jgi:hypothetical protein
VVFASVMVATSVLLVRILWPHGEPSVGPCLVALVFLASPAFVFFVHIIGYLDDYAVLLAIGFCFCAARARHDATVVAAALLGGGLLALIHEMLTWVFSPVVLFVLLCRTLRATSGRPTSRWFWAVPVAVWIGLMLEAVLVSVLGTRPAAQVDGMVRAIAQNVNFSLRGDAFDVLHRTMADNLLRLMPQYWSEPGNLATLARATWTAAPGILFLLVYGIHQIRTRTSDSRMRVTLVGALAIAVLSPHALNLIGWDTVRWNAFSLWEAFLCVAALHLLLPTATRLANAAPLAQDSAEPTPGPGSARPTTLWWVGGVAAVILGLCARPDLFDGYVVQWFPFDGQWRSAVDLWKGGFHFIPRS